MLGADATSVETALSSVPDLRARVEELAVIPDAFSEVFAEQGWVQYGHMSLEVAKSALDAARTDGTAAGEEVLLDYYSVETVQRHLSGMQGIAAFLPRSSWGGGGGGEGSTAAPKFTGELHGTFSFGCINRIIAHKLATMHTV